MMNLKKDRILNQINGIFDDGMSRVQDVAGDLEERSMQMARRAKDGLLQSRDTIVSLEEAFVRTVRKNPVLFIGAAVALAGLFVAKLLLEQRSRDIFSDID
jgi:hypothetical protein